MSTATRKTTTEKSDPRDTPAMRQYRRFKQQHPDCVLFFRMGDFYEMFDDDAVTVAKALNLTLTKRSTGIPMAGVPYHAAENYLRRMIAMGYRVAVCDQIQDPKEAKGVVDRAVTRVLTPGTLVDEQLLDESAANQVAAIQFLESGDDSAAVLAIAELSTGRFTLHDLPRGRVVDELARIRPTELVYVETADGSVPQRVDIVRENLGLSLTARPGWMFRHDDARDALLRHYNVTTLAGFGLDEHDPAIGPAGALLNYLLETQAGSGPDDTRDARERLGHLRPPVRQSHDAFLTIDAASLRSLEIERTMRTGQVDGSLLATLQRCNSPMGKRLLRQWLCFPLRDLKQIHVRQHAVAAMIADRDFTENLAEQIGNVQDVARIAGRMAMGRATPRDLVALGRSVGRINAIADLLDARPAFTSHHQHLTDLSEAIAPLADAITQRCVDDPPAHMREGGLFRDDVDAELDEARSLQRDANTWLAAYQKRLIESTDIPSLKVGYNKVFGYYIEITHAHVSKVPDAFSRKQTLKNAERYITPELKEFEEKVTTAESRAVEREKTLFDALCRKAAAQAPKLSAFAELVAELDVLGCFAEIATRFGYVKPELVEQPVLAIEDGRHPVLDRTLGERFVPNDCVLGSGEGSEALRQRGIKALRDQGIEASRGQGIEASRDQGIEGASEQGIESPNASMPQSLHASMPQCLNALPSSGSLALITGPNMAGKSTYIRQVALITLLAHTGSFVPAKSATIGLTDRIFTRIGASDELHAGHSTFMVEMTETANILHHATDRSLVILDEIGRGTSTLDGLSLAWAIAETLAVRQCRALFATHYHELTTLAERMDNVSNLHVSVREWGDEVVFLYRLLRGSTNRSYGIHVAKIAGVPQQTLQRAQELLDTLAVQTDATAVEAAAGSPAKKQPEAQMSLFTEYVHHPAIDELKAIDLNELTPMQAFDRLRMIIDSLNHQP